MARRPHFNVQRKSNRRLTQWFFISVPQVNIAANALSIVASLNAAALATTPFTIVRTRGLLTMWSDQVSAAEAPAGILGMIVVQNTAVLIGASAVPDPLNEAVADWYVYQPMQQPTSRQPQGSGPFIETGITQYVIDSKAMRKVDVEEDSVVMVRNTSGTEGLTVTFRGRALIKLH